MSGGDIERAAHEILARPEFRQHSTRGLLQRIVDDIGNWLSRFFTGLFSSAGGGGIGLALTLVVIALVLAAVILLARHVWVNRAAADSREKKESAVEEGALDSAGWLARASDAESRGDFAEVLRCRYRASVLDLAGHGYLDEIPGRTAGEHRAQLLRTLPPVYPDFSELTDSFESAWYAGVPAGPADGARSAELYAQVTTRTERR